MVRKKIILSAVSIFLLLVSFWFGRVTGRGSKEIEKSSHQEVSSTATNASKEAVPHAHKEGKADEHTEGKQEAEGFRLTPEEMRNIGLKTVVADLRPIERVIRTAGVVKPHPDKEAQVSSRVSGKIVGLFAKVGDAVQKG
ncbi:hypothetical protein EPO44_18370 [bacterium]|nr:MAG: hypothetical protein EPO44_18370 [bacterium]